MINTRPLHSAELQITSALRLSGRRVWQEMELEDAVHTALLTLKEGFEGQISGANIEVAVVGEDGKFRVLSASEVSDYLEEVE